MHRQTAASRSARFCRRLQHGRLGGVPKVTLSKPLSTSAHTSSLRVSIGHVLGGYVADTTEKNVMLRARKKIRIVLVILDAIFGAMELDILLCLVGKVYVRINLLVMKVDEK